MARVGVAVPTRNRSALLRESLVCLRDQLEPDIEVLVLDNASTDETAQIFRDTVGGDPRFRYRRQDTMVPALQNFRDGLDAMPVEYFMWRADDDLSAPNYIKQLADRLDAEPQADLAISSFQR